LRAISTSVILFDHVALFAANFDFFGEFGQTCASKALFGVEEIARGLIERGQRNGFEFESVFQQISSYGGLHFLHEIGALFVQFFHAHFGGDRAQRVDEFTFDQFFEFERFERFLTSVCAASPMASSVGFTRT
jgi:hypothetical protein